ncbi:unnamed protein product [Haemonchus placei]|uniref:RING-type domain-containing protein n=1 Tax=Haemonchus placei TaxID=6290 RepID=A0A158QR83_HAEPC|nr:unnamed protein product [Haemonchus placei]
MAKSIWLRATRQSGWCRCIICRDRMLDSPDPLHFSEDAQKFQKRLRKKSKAVKKGTYFANKNELHGLQNGRAFKEPTWKTDKPESNNAKSHSAPPVSSIPKTTCNRDAGADVTATPTAKTSNLSSRLDSIKAENSDTDETSNTLVDEKKLDSSPSIGEDSVVEFIDCTKNQITSGIYDKRRKGGGRRILSSLQTILENSSSSTLDSSILKGNPNDELWKDDELDLYRMHSFQNLHQLAPPFYHDSESMDSYGTITSQELLEAFEKGAEDNMNTPLYCPKDNRHASEDGNYTYTDLVYVSTPQKI